MPFSFSTLLRNAARNRNRNYRRRLKTKAQSPQQATFPIDVEWRTKFGAIRKRKQQPRLRFIDGVHRYCDTFLAATMTGVRLRGARNITLKLADLFGHDTLIHEVTVADVTRVRDRLVVEKYAPASINRYMSHLYSFLNVCCDNWQVIDEVPSIAHLKIARRAYRYLTDEEEVRPLSRCGETLRRLVLFILGTGARKGEAIHLTWNDVFIDGVPRGWVRFKTTKNGRPHSVPLPRHIRDMLTTMRLERPSNMDYVFWHTPKRDFRTGAGKIKSKKGVASPYLWPDRDFRQARSEAGLRDVRIHDLRHTYASRLVMKGVSLLFVNKLLNHADLEQTARYAHFSIDILSESVAPLDRPSQSPIGPDRSAYVAAIL